ncbi:MAG: DNA polymerase III [Treponema sp.]|nr:DNA polymerase III [Treponema sp.]MCL2252341.1 DNA polymerase III [Treponema sp.]
MFENIIEQSAVLQLRDDILSGRNAPSMLFYGPAASAKGSAALELARALSCEADSQTEFASWTCSCSSCKRHRYLQHDDLLVMGNRSFIAEITASSSAFLRNPIPINSKLLFFRSLRKMQYRFSPVFMEDEPNVKKLSSVLLSFDEGLSELLNIDTASCEKNAIEKLCKSLIDTANTLEKEGKLNSTIPINHIRSASRWCMLAPNGKRKTLIIENAENMRDDARNSLLKLLEEPPSSVTIVLTAQRREAIIPTILSRLRPYRFLKRSEASEKEVIRRVFQGNVDEIQDKDGSLISAYLESFASNNSEKLYPLAAWFLVSLARFIILSMRNKGIKVIPDFLNSLGERYAPIAETLKLERSVKSSEIIKIIITQTNKLENDLFSRFLKICLDIVSSVTRTLDSQNVMYNDIFIKYIKEAITAVDLLNINTNIALESLFYNIKNAIIEGYNG